MSDKKYHKTFVKDGKKIKKVIEADNWDDKLLRDRKKSKFNPIYRISDYDRVEDEIVGRAFVLRNGNLSVVMRGERLIVRLDHIVVRQASKKRLSGPKEP